MAKAKARIGLRSVKEISFKYTPEKLTGKFDPNQLRLGFDNRLESIDGEKDWITIDFGVKYFYKNEEVLHCIYAFNFTVDNVAQYVKLNPDQSVKVNVIMPRMLAVALGTLRGVILAKTAGTPIFDCPIPMVDVDETDR